MGPVILGVLLLLATAVFAFQLRSRLRLVAAAPGTLPFDHLALRVRRVLADVLGQRQTIRERPVTGVAHALVFWGFIAFSGYTAIDFLEGLRLVEVSGASWFTNYRIALTPFAIAVLAGIATLLVRRVVVRPAGLGARVSVESVAIGALIVILMSTFLLGWRLPEESTADAANDWVHRAAVLIFLVLIPASKHLHLLVSPVTVFFRSPELGAIADLNFERDEVGLESVGDLGPKTVLDAFACVECGRCEVNCPAWGAGQALDPKRIILQTEAALLAGPRDGKLANVYTEEALWQCTTCGACEKQCPVGVEHLPLIVGARRGLVSNGEAPAYLSGLYSNLERRANVWGLGSDERQKFVSSARLEVFDPDRHDVLVWLGCAGAFEREFQRSLRSLFEILQSCGIRFGVLAKESCTGDSAKRTGNEYLYQELAKANIQQLEASKVGGKPILTSCPHCVKTLGADYAGMGFHGNVMHSAVFVEKLTRGMSASEGGLTSDLRERDTVTYHDPCYLGRYQDVVDEPRALLARAGATVAEPVRSGNNPYCCGAGGGLLFANKEEAPGTRISDVRLGQLRDTGASTIVTACPFCSIMLQGSEANQPEPTPRIVDLMTYVSGRLLKRA